MKTFAFLFNLLVKLIKIVNHTFKNIMENKSIKIHVNAFEQINLIFQKLESLKSSWKPQNLIHNRLNNV
jgi:NADPH-dependent 7-cyano-7-deazaguanine reductase QueF-like protein